MDSLEARRRVATAMDEEDERLTEIESLEAIFPEMIRDEPLSFTLQLPVELARPAKVLFQGPLSSELAPESLHDTLSFKQLEAQSNATESATLWNLPPIIISFLLVEGYPTSAPPKVSIRVQEPWISQGHLDELAASVNKLWNDLGRTQVVYSYIAQLQEASEDGFGVTTDGVITLSRTLESALRDYEAQTQKAKFDSQTFTCEICLDPKSGTLCHRLHACGHVYCLGCLQDFYLSCIVEGDIDRVCCIHPDCQKDQVVSLAGRRRKKKAKKLQPGELLEIKISEEAVQRYVRLRRKRRLERNPNTVYCPRQFCQSPARLDNDSADNKLEDTSTDSESSDEEPQPSTPNSITIKREGEGTAQVEAEEDQNYQPPLQCLAVCTSCSFAFCSLCKRSWHGELGYCPGRPGSRARVAKEELATQEYLKNFTTPCPTCNARAQKTMGCNHMICRQCNTHFCYLCSSWLSSENPYLHFNTTGTPCYQRLWEMEEGDGQGVAAARPQAPPIEIIFEEARDQRPPQRVEDNDQPNPGRERGRGRGQRRGRGRGERQQVPAAGRARPPAPPLRADGVRVRRRVQQGLERAPPVRPAAIEALQGHGLQRFLEMADRDEEDGWDSDELEEQFIQFIIRD